MASVDLLQQRDLDGVLPPDQAAALAALTAGRPELARQAEQLHEVDADLRRVSLSLWTNDHHLALRSAIMAKVAERTPTAQVRVRPLDLVYAMAAAVLVLATYGLAGATVHTLFAQAVVMTWAVGLSLLLGLIMLLIPGLLRQAESSVLGAMMSRPVAIGPVDALVYRAVGLALVIGGIWLGV